MQDMATSMYGEFPEKKKTRWVLIIFLVLFSLGLLGAVAVSGAAGYFIWKYSKDLPNYDVLRKYSPDVMTRMHAADGELINEFAEERRIYVPINAIPKRVIHAFIAAEDKNFFRHGGVDFRATLIAMVRNISKVRQGRRAQGASTITQQVAKNFLLTNARSIERKIKEAILAIRIEDTYSKEKILELYLNKIYLGLRSYGIAAASLNYYGKSLDELTVGEAAYLASLPKAPQNYHPFRRTKKAIIRRNWVIGQMLENGFISSKEAEEAKAKGLNVNPRPFGTHLFAAKFFEEAVFKELKEIYGEKQVRTGGLSVRTTLNPRLQRLARKSLVTGLETYDRAFGWRGPVKKADLGDGSSWAKVFRGVEVLNDISPWRQAVVLEVSDNEAKIGLRPALMDNGRPEKKRVIGVIPLEDVQWAMPFKEYKNYKKHKIEKKKVASITDVLSAGDIVYVAPRIILPKVKKGEPKPKPQLVPGQWSLKQLPEIDGGIVVMDPHSGRVHALVGGFNFKKSQFDRVSSAQRQPGSSFKPFVYAAALDNGYSPASVMLDAPIAIEQGPDKEAWKPKNYGSKFYGPSTLRRGIEKSRNLMTVRLARDMGMPLISEYSKRFGIYDNLPPLLSMSLGAGETTLLKMTTAYCMLANGGKQVSATLIDRVQDRYGKTVWRHDKRECPDCVADKWDGQEEPVLLDSRKKVVSIHTAYQITSMLEGVVTRGTARNVRSVGKPLAGKTGTTNDEKDAWFIGFSPDLVVGVFIGFNNPAPMGKGATGGGLAAPIFRDFMKTALAGQPAVPFRIPPGIKLIKINGNTGARTDPNDPNAITEAFKPNENPPDEMTVLGGENWGKEQKSGPQPGGLY